MVEEQEITDFFQALVDSDRLEGAAAGIVRQIVGKGLDSLSPKQRWVYNREISDHVPEYCSGPCERYLEWNERIEALWNDGICYECDDDMSNDD